METKSIIILSISAFIFLTVIYLKVKYKTKPYTNEEWDELLNESWKNKNKEQ